MCWTMHTASRRVSQRKEERVTYSNWLCHQYQRNYFLSFLKTLELGNWAVRCSTRTKLQKDYRLHTTTQPASKASSPRYGKKRNKEKPRRQ
jgi:hypothetical protein